MAIKTKDTLKTYFNTGDRPTEGQFADLIDSLKHVNENPDLSGYAQTTDIPTDVAQLQDATGLLRDAITLPNVGLSSADLGKLAGIQEDGQAVLYQMHSENGKEYADLTPIGTIVYVDAQHVHISRAALQWFDFDNRYGDPSPQDLYGGLLVSGGKDGQARILPDHSHGKVLGKAMAIEGSPSQSPYRILVALDIMHNYIENQYAEPGYTEPGYVE